MLSGANPVNNIILKFASNVPKTVRTATRFAAKFWEKYITTNKKITIRTRLADIPTARADLQRDIVEWGPGAVKEGKAQRHVTGVHEIGHLLIEHATKSGDAHVPKTIMTGSSRELYNSNGKYWVVSKELFDGLVTNGYRTKSRGQVKVNIPR